MYKICVLCLVLIALVGCSNNGETSKKTAKGIAPSTEEKNVFKKVEKENFLITIEGAQKIAQEKTTNGILIVSNFHEEDPQSVYEIGILKEEKIHSYIISLQGEILHSAQENYMTAQSPNMSIYEAANMAFNKIGVSQLMESKYTVIEGKERYILLLKNTQGQYEVEIDVANKEVITVKQI